MHCFFKKKWANPDNSLFTFSLFKHKFCRKTYFSGIRIWIIIVEGEHAYYLTTTTAPKLNTVP